MAIDNANVVRLSEQGKKRYKRRAETVERSFADAKQHHGHRYAHYRGLSKVQIQFFPRSLYTKYQENGPYGMGFFVWFMAEITLIWAFAKNGENEYLQGYLKEK